MPSGNYQLLITGAPTAAPTVRSTVTTDNQTDGDDNGTQAGLGQPTISPIISWITDARPLDAAETFRVGPGQIQAANPDDQGDMTVGGFMQTISVGSADVHDADNDTQDVITHWKMASPV